MKTIKVAFYKNSRTLFGKLIRLKQYKLAKRYSIYSHTELVFENGISFSSSEVDGGVRFKDINFKTENWDFIDIEMSDKKYDEILKFCHKQAGNSYNIIGIFFAQVLNMNFKRADSWFCSEICTYALQRAGFLCSENSLFMPPARLACILETGDHIIDY